MAFNTWSYYFEWARRVGGTLTGSENELRLVRIIAGARGAALTGNMNKTQCLRAIAVSYGKGAAGLNEVQCLRAIVDVLGVKPANRTLNQMNERDCLAAILGGGVGDTPVVPPDDEFNYFRPGGVDTYFRPGGVDTYIRP